MSDIRILQDALLHTPRLHADRLKHIALLNDLYYTTITRAPVLAVGTLAYVDHLQAGLVPCKVVNVAITTRQDGERCYYVEAVITANRFGFTRGRIHTSECSGRIIPRKAIKRRGGNIHVQPFNFSTWSK